MNYVLFLEGSGQSDRWLIVLYLSDQHVKQNVYLMQALGFWSLMKQVPRLANIAADWGFSRMASVKRSIALFLEKKVSIRPYKLPTGVLD